MTQATNRQPQRSTDPITRTEPKGDPQSIALLHPAQQGTKLRRAGARPVLHRARRFTAVSPAEFDAAERQVDVFVVEKIALVESVGVNQEIEPEQHRTPREDLNLPCLAPGRSVNLAPADVVPGTSPIQCDADAVHANRHPVGQQQFWLHGAEPRIRFERGHEGFEPGVGDLRVIVENGDVLTVAAGSSGSSHPAVDRRTVALVVDPQPGINGQHFGSAVRVVDDDQAVETTSGPHRIDTATDHTRCTLMRHDDDGDRRDSRTVGAEQNLPRAVRFSIRPGRHSSSVGSQEPTKPKPKALCYPRSMGNRSVNIGQRMRSIAGARSWPRRTTAHVGEHDTQLAALHHRVADLWVALGQLQDHVHHLTTVVDNNHTWSQIQRGTAWAASAPLKATPVVSVILPTRDRSGLLVRAIESIQAQSYPHWDLVIINDGCTDNTGDTIARAIEADNRIRSVSTTGIGGAKARNAGLDIATGSIVTFLDDDNTMAPHWLRAVAEFMSRNGQCDAIYGAQLRLPVGSGAPNVLFAPTFDLEAFIVDNSVDLGMIAVRAHHPQLRFDPELRALQDWEMFTRIAATTAVTPVPALASCYSLSAPDRISDRHGGNAAVAAMRERLRATVAELQRG